MDYYANLADLPSFLAESSLSDDTFSPKSKLLVDPPREKVRRSRVTGLDQARERVFTITINQMSAAQIPAHLHGFCRHARSSPGECRGFNTSSDIQLEERGTFVINSSENSAVILWRLKSSHYSNRLKQLGVGQDDRRYFDPQRALRAQLILGV